MFQLSGILGDLLGGIPDLDIIPLLMKRLHLQVDSQKPLLEMQNIVGNTGIHFGLMKMF